jgi:hypothetical protein
VIRAAIQRAHDSSGALVALAVLAFTVWAHLAPKGVLMK